LCYNFGEGESSVPAFTVKFRELLQNAQEFGSNNEYMISRVFFSLDVDGKFVGNFYADLKQVVGSDFGLDSIEVSPPAGYSGPFDHSRFRSVAAEYFCGLVGPEGTAFRISGQGVRMFNNRVRQEAEYSF
jgi:hypothetical protein